MDGRVYSRFLNYEVIYLSIDPLQFIHLFIHSLSSEKRAAKKKPPKIKES